MHYSQKMFVNLRALEQHPQSTILRDRIAFFGLNGLKFESELFDC